MAVIKPFRALRPANAYAEQLLSLPYDVMNRREAEAMADGKTFSFLHISRSEIDMPEQENPYDPTVYEMAKQNLNRFRADGVLLMDPSPMFYIYRQTMDGRVQTGLVACVSIDEYQQDIIKKHEYTRVEKELDRIHHFDVCNANTEPVFLTFRDREDVRSQLEHQITLRPKEYEITTPDGVKHELWAINDKAVIESLEEKFREIPSLYIADGHHRSASAVKVGLKRREEFPDFVGDEEFNYFMAVLFPDNDLCVFDYNRVIKDLNGLDEISFLSRLSEHFYLEKKSSEPERPRRKHEFTMYMNQCWYVLTAKESILSDDAIKGLDVSILQDYVLAPILNILDPRTDKRIDFVGGIRGLSELQRRVDQGMVVAFALYPVSIKDLLTVSDLGMVMPPKSTWFEPKLGSGLFVHLL